MTKLKSKVEVHSYIKQQLEFMYNRLKSGVDAFDSKIRDPDAYRNQAVHNIIYEATDMSSRSTAFKVIDKHFSFMREISQLLHIKKSLKI